MKKIFTYLFCLFIGQSVYAQQQLKKLQKDDVAFSIVQAQIDGEDYTATYLEDDASLAFYIRDGKLNFLMWYREQAHNLMEK